MSRKRVFTLDKDSESIDSTKYRGMIGSLLYLNASRPNIIFSICLCARFQEDPKVSHLEVMKRTFSYLRLGLGLMLQEEEEEEEEKKGHDVTE
ncbi:hypothetical protein Tco_0180397 [Tanacetum coccineum]